MAQLTKERDHLFETIRTYRLLFETTRQLINEMQGWWHIFGSLQSTTLTVRPQRWRGGVRHQVLLFKSQQ